MKNRTGILLGTGILSIALVFGIWQGIEMRANIVRASGNALEAANLRQLGSVLDEQYREAKADVLISRDSLDESLNRVFPRHEDVSGLNRMFDDFAVRNNFASNPFVLSSLKYADLTHDKENENYNYVLISLDIESSKKNFDKFLEFIENSGSLESKVRLMELEAFTLNYPADYGGVYSTGLNIKAYFFDSLNGN